VIFEIFCGGEYWYCGCLEYDTVMVSIISILGQLVVSGFNLKTEAAFLNRTLLITNIVHGVITQQP